MTKVIFKKFAAGDIIAIFPYEKFDNAGNVSSYQKIGQHGACSPELIDELENATLQEYQPLFDELTKIVGYKLKVL